MIIMGCPTAQIVSLLKLIFLIVPVAVEGILATNLSVNTSHKSSYYTFLKQKTYFFDMLSHFYKDLFDCGFFSSFT